MEQNNSNRLAEIAEQISDRKQPPVHLWKPKQVGEIDIRIDAHGAWFHEGEAINRQPLVRLFSTILWCENDRHYLVTPAEKLAIQVADVPFIIQQMEQVDGLWVATSNVGEQLLVGAEHPVQLREFQGVEIPYIKVRYELWARLNRSIYYQWMSTAIEMMDDAAALPVLSSGDYQIKLATAMS